MNLVERLRRVSGNDIYLMGVPGTVNGHELASEAADEIERLCDLLNKTSANNRTKARELRRAKHTLREP